MKILVLDDDKVILKYLEANLRKRYPEFEIQSSYNVMQALLLIQSGQFVPDILITDYAMPQLNGFEFSKRVKEWSAKNNFFIYIVMLSGNANREIEINAFQVVDDFIRKPLDIEILFLRINVAIRTLKMINEKNNLIGKNDKFLKTLEEINERNESAINRLSLTIDQFLLSFSELIEYKDHHNVRHTYRVGELSKAIGKEMKLDDMADSLKYAGFLHDIGKIGIPDAVLRKSGPLTQDEMKLVQTHPEIGIKIIENIQYFKDSFDGVLYHHERWDGEGYPKKLKKDKIPLIARIVSVAEVYDVLMYPKPYRQARNQQESYDEILRNSQTQFDPDVVKAFSSIYQSGQVQSIYAV